MTPASKSTFSHGRVTVPLNPNSEVSVACRPDEGAFASGDNLWRSTDHGKTWKQLTKRTGDTVIVGLECDPADPQRLWFSGRTWDDSSKGGVFRTVDGGVTWQEITGNLPYRKPMVLRYNSGTRELWAGGVGLYRLKQ